MPQNEHSPLLENGGQRTPVGRRALAFIKGEGEPGFIQSYRHLLFGSWVNVLLLFVILSGVSHYMKWNAGLCFVFSFLAIIPLARLIGETTDAVSFRLNQTLSGLISASFGNAVEIIVGIAALLQGQLRIVQTSLLGSILGNILLVLGSSFIAGGFREDEGRFQVTAAQTSASLMTLGCITLIIPAAYHSAKAPPFFNEPIDPLSRLLTPPLKSLVDPEEINSGLLIISRGTAIMLLLVYFGYLFFQLGSHQYLFVPRDDQEVEVREPGMSAFAAASALLLVTVLTAFVADWLVGSIEETASRYNIPKPFIGLIIIPIVANAAEHTTSISMALRGKYELTIGICVGSSIQIALFVVPLLVLVGWISGHELTLFFSDFETVVLFVSVLLVNMLIMDGKSNYMEGLMLVTLYIVIALAFWVS